MKLNFSTVLSVSIFLAELLGIVPVSAAPRINQTFWLSDRGARVAIRVISAGPLPPGTDSPETLYYRVEFRCRNVSTNGDIPAVPIVVLKDPRGNIYIPMQEWGISPPNIQMTADGKPLNAFNSLSHGLTEDIGQVYALPLSWWHGGKGWQVLVVAGDRGAAASIPLPRFCFITEKGC